MTVRTRVKLAIAVSRTSAEEKDLGDLAFEAVDDSQGEGGSWKTVVPQGAVDQQLFLPNVASAKLLTIVTAPVDPTATPSVVLFRLNLVTNEQIRVAPNGTNKQGFLCLTTDQGILALFASNPGTVDMEVVIAVAGD